MRPKFFSFSLTFFLYADHLKICRAVQTFRDATSLQRDLNELYELYLNAEKCFVISFNRRRTTVDFEYIVDLGANWRICSNECIYLFTRARMLSSREKL